MGKIIINANNISLSACHYIASRGGSPIWTGTKKHINHWPKQLNLRLFPVPPSSFQSHLAKNVTKTQQKSLCVRLTGRPSTLSCSPCGPRSIRWAKRRSPCPWKPHVAVSRSWKRLRCEETWRPNRSRTRHCWRQNSSLNDFQMRVTCKPHPHLKH